MELTLKSYDSVNPTEISTKDQAVDYFSKKHLYIERSIYETTKDENSLLMKKGKKIVTYHIGINEMKNAREIVDATYVTKNGGNESQKFLFPLVGYERVN